MEQSLQTLVKWYNKEQVPAYCSSVKGSENTLVGAYEVLREALIPSANSDESIFSSSDSYPAVLYRLVADCSDEIKQYCGEKHRGLASFLLRELSRMGVGDLPTINSLLNCTLEQNFGSPVWTSSALDQPQVQCPDSFQELHNVCAKSYSLHNEFIGQTVGRCLVGLTRHLPKPVHNPGACRTYKQINLCRLCMLYCRMLKVRVYLPARNLAFKFPLHTVLWLSKMAPDHRGRPQGEKEQESTDKQQRDQYKTGPNKIHTQANMTENDHFQVGLPSDRTKNGLSADLWIISLRHYRGIQ